MATIIGLEGSPASVSHFRNQPNRKSLAEIALIFEFFTFPDSRDAIPLPVRAASQDREIAEARMVFSPCTHEPEPAAAMLWSLWLPSPAIEATKISTPSFVRKPIVASMAQ